MNHIRVWVSVFVVGISGFSTLAQSDGDNSNTNQIQPYSSEIEGNFLSSYYQQDGDNAAVTGGVGSEELTDFANVIVLHVPLDSTQALGFFGGVDAYTSASSDQVGTRSSASGKDSRAFGTFSYTRLNLKKGETYSAKIGVSTEYDYFSISGGLSFTKEWNQGNSEITVAGQAFIDKWSLFYPEELRGDVSVASPGRQSYNAQVIYSQILNKRLQMSLSAEAIYMTGLLSTPFHRVYFSDNSLDVERLPDSRLKIPLSVRLNYYPMDNLVLRSYYRYYWDDFGIKGSTAELEAAVKVSQSFTVSPFYRYHTQTAADYFAPYKEHNPADEFYTSDYDLSSLSSNKYGVGIKYYPVYGITRSKPMFKNKRVFSMKYIEFRGAAYNRDTGLDAFIGTLNIGFGFK